MKNPIILAALLVPGMASAQLAPPPYENLSFPTVTLGLPQTVVDTPTMARDRLRRALALKQEAALLLEADGGRFTREHEAYIRRKARDILGG